jgi:hypothetical protein
MAVTALGLELMHHPIGRLCLRYEAPNQIRRPFDRWWWLRRGEVRWGWLVGQKEGRAIAVNEVSRDRATRETCKLTPPRWIVYPRNLTIQQ